MNTWPQDSFFEYYDKAFMDLSFDDVTMGTRHTAIMPHQADVTSLFARGVPLGRPFISAAMDRVSEELMAIAIAKYGGLGIIHRSFTPEEQERRVDRVKHHLHGMIPKPICVHATQTLGEVTDKIAKHKFGFRSFPVLDDQDRLVGMLTGHDLDCNDDNLSRTVAQAMTGDHLVTAPANTTMEQAWQLLRKTKKKFLPLVDADNHVVGLYVFSDVLRIMTGDRSHFNVDDLGRLCVGAATGVYEDALERAALLVGKVDVLVIDTAHADTDSVIATIRQLKATYPNLPIVAGNVSSFESAVLLAGAGADGIKVGQGSGSICTTRQVTGCGRPQLTAVHECAKALRDRGIPICSDGGINYPGDGAKAIAAGAMSIMMGSMLAGTDEAPGPVILIRDGRYKDYRGMGSREALAESAAARARYNQNAKSTLVPEGVPGLVPCKGPVTDILDQCLGGLQRSMSSQGALTIPDLWRTARFRFITSGGQRESGTRVLIRDGQTHFEGAPQ